MESIRNSCLGSWICLGDFNKVLSQTEKKGSRLVASPSTGGLHNFILNMGLVDIEFVGNLFTWCNGRHGLILEHLDRAMANRDQRTLFPQATLHHLPRNASDHAPIFLDTQGENSSGPRLFRFEPFWTKDNSCKGDSKCLEIQW